MKFTRFIIALIVFLVFFGAALNSSAQDDPITPTVEATETLVVEVTEIAPVVVDGTAGSPILEVTEPAPVDVDTPVIVVQPPTTPAAPSWDDVLTKVLLGLAVLGLIFSDPPKIRRGIQDAGQYVQTTKNPVDDILFQVLKPYAEQVANLSEQLRGVQEQLKTQIPPAFRDDTGAFG